jgi:ribonuclease P protein component
LVKFKNLFSFSKTEVEKSFSHASFVIKQHGLKLLRVSNSDQPHGKLLAVISKKYGKAHERNLMRRRIKNIFYNQKLFEIKATWILIVYENSKQLEYSQLQDVLTKSIAGPSHEIS